MHCLRFVMQHLRRFCQFLPYMLEQPSRLLRVLRVLLSVGNVLILRRVFAVSSRLLDLLRRRIQPMFHMPFPETCSFERTLSAYMRQESVLRYVWRGPVQ